jgi:predicted aspartyl protease
MKNWGIIKMSLLLLTGCMGGRHVVTGPAGYYRADSLLKHKQFFAAKQLLEAGSPLPRLYELRMRTELDNAFNQPASAIRHADTLLREFAPQLSRAERLRLLDIQQTCYARLYNYAGALSTIDQLIEQHGRKMSDKDLADYKNTRTIWQALAAQPPQAVVVKATTLIELKRDTVGLVNLSVSNGADSLGFIFDTGANLSTTTESTAQRLGMELMGGTVLVTSITGNKVPARIAVCRQLFIRHIEIRNAVFLVFPDKALQIPQINYQINGIIGFPVIEALGEMQFEKNKYLLIPQEPSRSDLRNMALDFLTPVIEIEGLAYTFDTGADNTMLYQPWYKRFANRIDGRYPLETLSFAGAGGAISRKGYRVNFTASVAGKQIVLDSLQLFPEPLKAKEDDYYGNIGQDLIGQFDRMTLNFRSMFIRFE